MTRSTCSSRVHRVGVNLRAHKLMTTARILCSKYCFHAIQLPHYNVLACLSRKFLHILSISPAITLLDLVFDIVVFFATNLGDRIQVTARNDSSGPEEVTLMH